MSKGKLIVLSMAAGFGGFCALLLAIVASGQTFGQRCAAVYDRGTTAHERCVARLSDGGPVHAENEALR